MNDEIQNDALPGDPGYGWRYFAGGVTIDPDGDYYKDGQLVWSPASNPEVVSRAANGDPSALGLINDIVKMAPQIAAGISAFQLSQINVQRAKLGQAPLSSAYNPGFNVGLSSSTIMAVGLGVIALLLFTGSGSRR